MWQNRLTSNGEISFSVLGQVLKRPEGGGSSSLASVISLCNGSCAERDYTSGIQWLLPGVYLGAWPALLGASQASVEVSAWSVIPFRCLVGT